MANWDSRPRGGSDTEAGINCSSFQKGTSFHVSGELDMDVEEQIDLSNNNSTIIIVSVACDSSLSPVRMVDEEENGIAKPRIAHSNYADDSELPPGLTKSSSTCSSASWPAATSVDGRSAEIATATVASQNSAGALAANSQGFLDELASFSNSSPPSEPTALFQTATTETVSTKGSAAMEAEEMLEILSCVSGPPAIQINSASLTVQKTPKSTGTILGMNRLAFLMVGLLAIGTVLLAVWMGMMMSDKHSQMEQLETQVDRLTIQMNELASETQQLKTNNNALNESIYYSQQRNRELRNTRIRLTQTGIQLNTSFLFLQKTVLELGNVTEQISMQNHALHKTNVALQVDVDTLNATVTALDEENQAMKNTINNLEANMTSLETDIQQLGETQVRLNALNRVATELNDRWNQNLRKFDSLLLPFFNAWFNGTEGDTFNRTVGILSKSIRVNRNLGVEQSHLEYLGQYRNWDCPMALKYQTNFRNERKILDPTTLGQLLSDMSTATGLVTQICLNNTNYQEYLNYWHDIDTPKITLQQFVDGTDTYSLEALLYMFPNSPQLCGSSMIIGNVTCLSHDHWEVAKYTCKGIADAGLQYRWTAPTTV